MGKADLGEAFIRSLRKPGAAGVAAADVDPDGRVCGALRDAVVDQADVASQALIGIVAIGVT